jgi:hypothetical protein
MSRDGRGNPGRYVLKNPPRLKLADLLRRRKMTLKQLLVELGISTYEALCIRCNRMGVTPPDQLEFEIVVPPSLRVNSPQEGVVVLEPPPVIDEISGQEIDPSLPVEPPGIVVLTDKHFVSSEVAEPEQLPEPTEMPQKKPRKKKDVLPTE